MKQSKTTLKELTAAYRAVLRHGILCNAIALGLIAATPARAETITYSGYNGSQGALAIIDGSEHIGGEALVFENNTSTSHGAGLYYKVTDDGLSSSVILDAASITFNNNASNYDKSSGGALFNSGGDVSVLGDTNVFTNNHISGVDGTKPFKRGGGAVANQSYETESNSEPKVSLDATMVIGKLDGTSENTFSNNTSSMNGGAIMNRALDTDGNATLTINGTTTFDSNTAAMNGGAIYNVQRDGKTATVNLNNGEYTFTNNVANDKGGAVYNEGTMTLANATFGGVDNSGDTPVSLGNTANRGGAINNASGTITVNNAEFINNVASNMGGAINADAGTVIVNNSEFIGNDGGIYGGAIASVFNTVNKIEINGSDFAGNRAQLGGAIAAYQTLEITNSNFTNNETTIVEDGGGAIVLGGHGKATITGTTFDGNKSNLGGAIATRPRGANAMGDGAAAGNEDGHWMVIEDSIFTNNVADATLVNAENGTIHTYGGHNMYNGDGGAIWHGFEGSTVNGIVHNNEINNSQFSLNIARHNGGAIYNEGNLILTDDTFTNNSADGLGGAIFNEGNMTIAAMNSDVDFYGNTANGVDNDIYNAGSLTLHVGSNQLISLAGGIDGLNGTLDIVGDGLVDISNSLNNQTVNVAGQLHLSDPMTLEGTTINVVESALLNTLDNTINNYSSHAFLGNNSNVMVDVSSDGVDTFNIANGNHAHVEAFTMLSDLAGDSAVRHLADYGSISVNSDFHAYTTESMYSLAGNSMNDGTVTVTKAGAGTGGLFAAINGTTDEDYQGMYYSLTGNDTSVDSGTTLRNAEIDVLGAGTGDGDYGIALNGHIVVDGQSSFVTHNAKIEGNGSIENSEGGEIGFNNSKIGVEVNNEGIVGIVDSTLAAGSTFENRVGATTVVFDSVIDAEVVNYGRWISDPSTYSGIVHNYSDEISFDNDTFTSTAELENMGTADLKNSVTFANGAEITGTGVINLVSGTTHFNDTASSNTINLLNGADFDGVLTGTGILNMSNGTIDTVTGGVAGGGLIVDANLKGAGTIDTLTGGTTGAKIKTINVLNSEYGTAESLSLNVGGATLADDLHINGMNYYTKVETDGDNLVFSDKLINRSALTSTLEDYAALALDNVFTGENTFKNANGINIANADASISANLKAAAYDASYNALYVTGVDGVIAKSFAATDGGFMTDHFSADDAAIELKNSSNETVFLADNTGALTVAGLATLGGLKLGDVTVTGIDTTVGAHADKLITSGAVNTALAGKQDALTAGNGIILSGAGNSVVSVKSGDGTIVVGADGVKVGTIGTANIANGAVTTDQIANGTITFADLNSDMVSSTSTMNVAAPSDNKLVTEAAVVAGITTLFNDKQGWMDDTMGIVSAHADAVQEQYAGTNYLASATSLTGADKALDSALKTTNDTIGAGEIGAGTAGTLTGQTIGAAEGNITVTSALSTLNATNVNQNSTMNTMAGLINGGTVDSATGVLTGGTALATGTNGSNLVAATNTLSSLVNHNGTDAIIHRDFQTENMTVDASKSIVENINVISAELQNAESRVKVLEDNMIGADTVATFTNKTIDADVNTITNLEVDNFKDGVVSQSIGTTGSENKLASEKAVRDAINERTTMGSTAGSNYDASATVVQAIETIDQNMGKIDGLVTAQTATTTSSGLAYNGNLAHGSATVEHHLSSLDASIGDMRGFATENNYATDTESVAANLVALDGQLKTTTDAVDTLANGDENTVGSVRNIAKSYFDLAAQSDALTLSAANAYTDKRIEKLDRDLSAGIASAVALSSVAVSDVRRGELSVGAGYGYFNGQSAGAFGAAMGISNRWSVNAGAGISGYDVSFRAGTNYKFKVF